jgi:NitT/TauT family transport system substrate-binding protein
MSLTKQLLCSALLALAAIASEHAVRAEAPIHVGISQPTYSFIPLDIGLQTGIFEKHGLTIEKIVFNGSAKVHQALAAGSIDIVLGAGPEFGFVAKGAPELAVEALADAPADLALSVLKDGPIQSVADLKGKRVSVSTVGSLTEWAAQELSRKQGWGPNGMILVPLGSFTSQTAALKTHQIDAMLTEAGTAGRMEEAGSGRTLVTFGDLVEHFHIHVIFAHDDFIKNHPDELRGFLAGILESVRYARAHKPETVTIASKVLGMSPTLSGKLYDTLMPMYNPTGRFDPRALDTLAEAMVSMGEMDKKPDMQSLLTEKYLPENP